MITINGEPLNITIFPDKTSQVWKIPNMGLWAEPVHITWTFANEGEFLHLAQLKTLLDKYNLNTLLFIEYLPYARQDKEVSNNSTFALRTFSKLLNLLRFDEIIIKDPHSQVALDLINNSVKTFPLPQLFAAMDSFNADLFCYPDKGALEKYSKAYEFPYIYGEKIREQSTGNIINYTLMGSPKGLNILIVDDICDGGATFKLLAKDLLAAGAKEVNLFVTHGIFSKGTQTLRDSGIKRIFTKEGEIL